MTYYSSYRLPSNQQFSHSSPGGDIKCTYSVYVYVVNRSVCCVVAYDIAAKIYRLNVLRLSTPDVKSINSNL